MFSFKTDLNAITAHRPMQINLIKALGAMLTLSMLSSGAAASNDGNTQVNTQSERTVGSYLESRDATPSQTSLLDYYCRDDIADQTEHDKHVSAERRLIDCMLTELEIYRYTELQPVQQYHAFKVQGWLNFASYQDSQNHRSDAGRLAIEMAHETLEALRKDQDQDQTQSQALSINSDFLNKKTADSNHVMLMRPDLWAKLTALKEMGGINITPRELALSEVGLIWAMVEYCDRGWRKSAPNFRMVNRWLEQANEAFINQHDSQTNLTLEALTNRYFQQYESYKDSDDVCLDEKFGLSLINKRT